MSDNDFVSVRTGQVQEKVGKIWNSYCNTAPAITKTAVPLDAHVCHAYLENSALRGKATFAWNQ